MHEPTPRTIEAAAPAEGLTLGELGAILWGRRWLIAGLTLGFMLVGGAYAFLATPVFRAEAVLSPVSQNQSIQLPEGLGGLASMAGINLGASEGGTEALATLRSRAFIEKFIKDGNLLPVLFSDEWDSVKGQWRDADPEDWPDVRDGVKYVIEKVRFVNEDSRTGLITLAVEWVDPRLAAEWVEELVGRINEQLRARDLENSQRKLEYLKSELDKTRSVELQEAVSRLIEKEIQKVTLAHSEKEYAFKMIDPPRVPHKHIFPKRALIISVAGLVGAVLGAFIAIFGWVAAQGARRS